jgi:hypothetical protein
VIANFQAPGPTVREDFSQPEPYRIHYAETWGGASAKEEDVMTPGVRAAIHLSASGAVKGGDLHYLSVCAYDTLTRIAVVDVRGHGEAVSDLSEWLYLSLERPYCQKFMQHSGNTSITRRGAHDSVLGFWDFGGRPFPTGRGGRYLSLGGFFRRENDR